FEDLCTFEGIIYDTFKDAVKARGLLDSNHEWTKYFNEAVTFKMPNMLRQLFVIIVNMGEEVDVTALWEQFKKDMYEDFVHKGFDEEKAENLAKIDIEKQLELVNKSLAKFGISLPVEMLLTDEETWDKEKELDLGNEMRETMNDRQEKIVKHIFCKVRQMKNGTMKNGCIFIDGPGGSGKTYIYKTLCHLFRAQDIKYKTSSWMGIAANLIPDGRTMHSTFGLLFDLDKDSTSSAKEN